MSSGGLVPRTVGRRGQGNVWGGLYSHTTWEYVYTHTNLSQTQPWAHIDSQTLSEGLACWQRLKEDIIRKYTHTSNIFCSSKQAAGESTLYISIFSYSSLPSLLPIREVLLLPGWLHPSIPLTASWGVLLVEAAGSLFRHTAPTLACSNATPLWGQNKVAVTCIYVFLPYVVNYMERYIVFSLHNI